MTNQSKDPQNQITGAIILIFIGLIFLINRLGFVEFQNWWAFFILIPAISSTSTLINNLRQGANPLKSIGEGVIGIFFPVVIAGIFLFNLSWVKLWPLFIIIAGFSMLITGLLPLGEGIGSIPKSIRPWIITWGLGVVLTGVFLLVQTLEIMSMKIFYTNWWGIPILVAASGGIFSVFLSKEETSKTGIFLNLMAALLLSIPGVFVLLGLQTNIVLPLIIIVVGILLILSFINGKK